MQLWTALADGFKSDVCASCTGNVDGGEIRSSTADTHQVIITIDADANSFQNRKLQITWKEQFPVQGRYPAYFRERRTGVAKHRRKSWHPVNRAIPWWCSKWNIHNLKRAQAYGHSIEDKLYDFIVGSQRNVLQGCCIDLHESFEQPDRQCQI